MISLMRIDDRLIHGQVIIAWGIKLKPDRYVIIDDDLDEWDGELYLGCLENESCGCIMTAKEASSHFEKWKMCKEHYIILVRCPRTLENLKKYGIQLPDINLGGLHYLEGKTQYLKCLYLYDDERDSLKRLCAEHKILYQPLPSDSKVNIKNII